MCGESREFRPGLVAEGGKRVGDPRLGRIPASVAAVDRDGPGALAGGDPGVRDPALVGDRPHAQESARRLLRRSGTGRSRHAPVPATAAARLRAIAARTHPALTAGHLLVATLTASTIAVSATYANVRHRARRYSRGARGRPCSSARSRIGSSARSMDSICRKRLRSSWLSIEAPLADASRPACRQTVGGGRLPRQRPLSVADVAARCCLTRYQPPPWRPGCGSRRPQPGRPGWWCRRVCGVRRRRAAAGA
jgi:hypothetical protein